MSIAVLMLRFTLDDKKKHDYDEKQMKNIDSQQRKPKEQ